VEAWGLGGHEPRTSVREEAVSACGLRLAPVRWSFRSRGLGSWVLGLEVVLPHRCENKRQLAQPRAPRVSGGRTASRERKLPELEHPRSNFFHSASSHSRLAVARAKLQPPEAENGEPPTSVGGEDRHAFFLALRAAKAGGSPLGAAAPGAWRLGGLGAWRLGGHEPRTSVRGETASACGLRRAPVRWSFRSAVRIKRQFLQLASRRLQPAVGQTGVQFSKCAEIGVCLPVLSVSSHSRPAGTRTSTKVRLTWAFAGGP